MDAVYCIRITAGCLAHQASPARRSYLETKYSSSPPSSSTLPPPPPSLLLLSAPPSSYFLLLPPPTPSSALGFKACLRDWLGSRGGEEGQAWWWYSRWVIMLELASHVLCPMEIGVKMADFSEASLMRNATTGKENKYLEDKKLYPWCYLSSKSINLKSTTGMVKIVTKHLLILIWKKYIFFICCSLLMDLGQYQQQYPTVHSGGISRGRVHGYGCWR